MQNLDVLKEYVDYVNAQYNSIKDSTDRDKVVEVFSNICNTSHDLPFNGEGISLAVRFPVIKDDIDVVAQSYDETLEEDDYEYLIDKILDFDYSDYNDKIADLIIELNKEKNSNEKEI